MPGQGRSGCEGCRGRCCRHYQVGISGADAHRLASAQLLPIESFARLVEAEKGTRGALVLDDSGTWHQLALLRWEDGTCVFLVELGDGDLGRCGVYAERPRVCSTYPMTLRNGTVALRDDVMCPPEAWNVAGLELSTWRATLLRQELDWVLYGELLEAWNARAVEQPQTPHAFYAWLLETYRRVDDVLAELGEDGMDAASADLAAVARGDSAGPAGSLLARAAELAAR